MFKIISALAITLLISASAYADGSSWKTDLNALDQKLGTVEPLQIQAEKSTYFKNDKVKLGIVIPKQGYLNVINVDEKGETTLLFPNAKHSNNKVKEGIFVFPTTQMAFDLVTGAPYGKSVVIAFFSQEKIKLNPPKSANKMFSILSDSEVQSLQKSIFVQERETEKTFKAAGKLELMTCKTAESC